MCMTATALADNPNYKRPVLPDVYQGNGVYVEIEPIVIQSNENWRSYHSNIGDGLLKVGTEMKSTEKDPDGYTKPGKERYTAFVNTRGEIVIPPMKGTATFDFGDFHDGLAWFKDQSSNPWKYGYMNTHGDVVIKPRFSHPADFHDGVACVDGMLINTSGGVVAEGFDSFHDSFRARTYVSDGMIRYTGKLPSGDYFSGYLDLKGQPAVTIFKGQINEYYSQKQELAEPVSDFHDGYAVLKEHKSGRLYPTYIIIDKSGTEVYRMKDTPPFRLETGTIVGDGKITAQRIDTETGKTVGRALDLRGNVVAEASFDSEAYFSDGVIPGGRDRDGFYSLLLDETGTAVMPKDLFADSNGNIDYTEKERFYRHHPEYSSSDDLVWSLHNGETQFTGVESGSTVLTLELKDGNAMGGESKASWAWTMSVHSGTYTGSGIVWAKNARVYPDQQGPAKEKTMVPESNNSWMASDRHQSTSTAEGIDHKQHTVYHYAAGTAFQLQMEMGNATDVGIFLKLDKKGVWDPKQWNIYDTGMYGVNGSAKFNEDQWLLLPEGHIVCMGNAYVCVGAKQTPPPKPDPKPQPVKPSNEPSAWAKEQVDAAKTAGIVPASLQSAYNAGATRAEFCALACQTYETLCGPITGYESVSFSDTNDVNVLKMASVGVVDGVGNGKFAPEKGLTREQAATMLARLAKATGAPLEKAAPTFADNQSIASWAKDAVGQIQKSGVMGGNNHNQFLPKGDYTREQSILTALRLYNMLK